MTRRKARGRRGGGTVFWDAARGCYTGQFSMGRDVETRKRRRSPKVHAATEAECWELLDAMREEHRKTGMVARRDITVQMVVRDVLDNPPEDWKSEITFNVYRNPAEHIIAAIGSVRLARLTAGQVDGMLRQMAREGCSRRTISGARSLLVRAIRRAERDGAVTRNVAALSIMPAAPGRVSKALTMEQVGALLTLDLTPWWRAFVTVGVMTGLRPGELLGLGWEDADLDTGLLRVRQALKRGAEGKGRAGLAPGTSRRRSRGGPCACPCLPVRRSRCCAASRPPTGSASASSTRRPGSCSPTAPGGQCGRRRQRGNSRTCARRRRSAATGSCGN